MFSRERIDLSFGCFARRATQGIVARMSGATSGTRSRGSPGYRFAHPGYEKPNSRPAADQVNLDQRVVGKPGDTDAGAGRQAVRRKELAISLVHCGVVFLETCEINACHHDVFETEIDARQYYLQI